MILVMGYRSSVLVSSAGPRAVLAATFASSFFRAFSFTFSSFALFRWARSKL